MIETPESELRASEKRLWILLLLPPRLRKANEMLNLFFTSADGEEEEKRDRSLTAARTQREMTYEWKGRRNDLDWRL